jgi:hypothetical protein
VRKGKDKKKREKKRKRKRKEKETLELPHIIKGRSVAEGDKNTNGHTREESRQHPYSPWVWSFRAASSINTVWTQYSQ